MPEQDPKPQPQSGPEFIEMTYEELGIPRPGSQPQSDPEVIEMTYEELGIPRPESGPWEPSLLSNPAEYMQRMRAGIVDSQSQSESDQPTPPGIGPQPNFGVIPEGGPDFIGAYKLKKEYDARKEAAGPDISAAQEKAKKHRGAFDFEAYIDDVESGIFPNEEDRQRARELKSRYSSIPFGRALGRLTEGTERMPLSEAMEYLKKLPVMARKRLLEVPTNRTLLEDALGEKDAEKFIRDITEQKPIKIDFEPPKPFELKSDITWDSAINRIKSSEIIARQKEAQTKYQEKQAAAESRGNVWVPMLEREVPKDMYTAPMNQEFKTPSGKVKWNGSLEQLQKAMNGQTEGMSDQMKQDADRIFGILSDRSQTAAGKILRSVADGILTPIASVGALVDDRFYNDLHYMSTRPENPDNQFANYMGGISKEIATIATIAAISVASRGVAAPAVTRIASAAGMGGAAASVIAENIPVAASVSLNFIRGYADAQQEHMSKYGVKDVTLAFGSGLINSWDGLTGADRIASSLFSGKYTKGLLEGSLAKAAQKGALSEAEIGMIKGLNASKMKGVYIGAVANQAIRGALTEGFQEVVQGMLEDSWKKFYGAKDFWLGKKKITPYETRDIWDVVKDEGGAGAIIGMLFGSALGLRRAANIRRLRNEAIQMNLELASELGMFKMEKPLTATDIPTESFPAESAPGTMMPSETPIDATPGIEATPDAMVSAEVPVEATPAIGDLPDYTIASYAAPAVSPTPEANPGTTESINPDPASTSDSMAPSGDLFTASVETVNEINSLLEKTTNPSETLELSRRRHEALNTMKDIASKAGNPENMMSIIRSLEPEVTKDTVLPGDPEFEYVENYAAMKSLVDSLNGMFRSIMSETGITPEDQKMLRDLIMVTQAIDSLIGIEINSDNEVFFVDPDGQKTAISDIARYDRPVDPVDEIQGKINNVSMAQEIASMAEREGINPASPIGEDLKIIRGTSESPEGKVIAPYGITASQFVDTKNGAEWLIYNYDSNISRTKPGYEFLHLPEGREWLKTPTGLRWLETESGKEWYKENISTLAMEDKIQGLAEKQRPILKDLKSPEFLGWVKSDDFMSFVQTRAGKAWLSGTGAGLKAMAILEGQGVDRQMARDFLETISSQAEEMAKIKEKHERLKSFGIDPSLVADPTPNAKISDEEVDAKIYDLSDSTDKFMEEVELSKKLQDTASSTFREAISKITNEDYESEFDNKVYQTKDELMEDMFGPIFADQSIDSEMKQSAIVEVLKGISEDGTYDDRAIAAITAFLLMHLPDSQISQQTSESSEATDEINEDDGPDGLPIETCG
jgi:hypothetical protein